MRYAIRMGKIYWIIDGTPRDFGNSNCDKIFLMDAFNAAVEFRNIGFLRAQECTVPRAASEQRKTAFNKRRLRKVSRVKSGAVLWNSEATVLVCLLCGNALAASPMKCDLFPINLSVAKSNFQSTTGFSDLWGLFSIRPPLYFGITVRLQQRPIGLGAGSWATSQHLFHV